MGEFFLNVHQIIALGYYVALVDVLHGVLFVKRTSIKPRLNHKGVRVFGAFMLAITGFVPVLNLLTILTFAINYERIMEDFRK